jgi:hypothetical protein
MLTIVSKTKIRDKKQGTRNKETRIQEEGREKWSRN